MRGLAGIALASLAVVAAAAAQGVPPPPPAFERFQTPSRNVGCAYAPAGGHRPAFLRCDILSGLVPTPKHACQLDWTGYGMIYRGRAYPVCAGDTVFARNARVLRYGSRWTRGPFTCVSRRTGLRCTNRSGRGFVVARTRSFAF